MDNRDNSKVLVVIPAWNEEKTIGQVVEGIKSLYTDVTVLVVDDGSSDRTAEIARNSGAQVLQGGHQGYTAAIQRGRTFALSNGYQWVAFMDADGQHSPQELGEILQLLLAGEADQVRGSRGLGRYEWQEPLILKLPRHICCFLVSLKLRKRFTDVTSGFKAETRTVSEYLQHVYATSSRIHRSNTNDIEEHLLLAKKGLRLAEVPVTMRSRVAGDTKCYTPRQLLVFPWDLIVSFIRNW